LKLLKFLKFTVPGDIQMQFEFDYLENKFSSDYNLLIVGLSPLKIEVSFYPLTNNS